MAVEKRKPSNYIIQDKQLDPEKGVP